MSNSNNSYNKWIVIGFLTVPVSYLLMIFLLWYLNFFDFTGTDASAKIVGTALTLGGGLVATMVTLIGLILRQSVENRNADLRDEAEKRLKLEASIRAVDLLGTSEGKNSTEAQLTGALYSLARLGMIDLAVDLVHFMRPANLIGPGATASLLDLALRSKDRQIQEKAAGFLTEHFETLLTEEGLEWPGYIWDDWPSELSYYSRTNAFTGLIEVLLARPKREWDEFLLPGFISCLAIALRSEQDERLKSKIALCLNEILGIYAEDVIIQLHDENLKIGTIHNYILKTDTEIVSGQSRELIARLSKWVDESDEKTDSNLT